MVGLDRYLGTARTGRKVGLYVTNDLEYIRSQIADYDPHENFDAYCILQWHMVEAIRRYGLEAEDLKILEFMSDLHWQTLTEECSTGTAWGLI